MINLYHSWSGAIDPLYNGREYERYPFYINSGLPYFGTDTLTNAILVYDGLTYDRIPVLYDLIIDELIIKSHDGNKLLKLVKQKVDSFSFGGAIFVGMRAGDKNIPEGYYQLLHDGSTTVLKKEVRRIQSDVKEGEQLQKNIKSKIAYYVKENDQYRRVSSSRTIKLYDKLTQ